MKIYVINLRRAADRRRKMETQAKNLNLDFDFIEATDGRFLTDEDRARVDQDRRKRISKYPLTDNEIGCWISHRRAMQMLVDSEAPMAAILEDDAGLSPDFPRVLAAIENFGIPFDFIDLHRLFKSNEVFAPCRPLTPGYDLGRVGHMHMHATSYVMSRAGAEKFLAYSRRFAHVVDKEMHRYWANGLDVYGLDKPVAWQDDGGFSYIDETRHEDDPRQRVPLPGADSLYWGLQRKWERLEDSVIKRMAFPFYVLKGRRARARAAS